MATEDLTFRFNVTGNAVPQMQKVQDQVRKVDRQIKRSTGTLKTHARQYNHTSVMTNKWAKGALQQAGYQIGDFAVQAANGTDKLQAFGQQGSQMLGVFGPIGAILGAAVAIFSAVGVAAKKSGKAMDGLGSTLGVLEKPLTSVVESVQSMRDAFGSVMPFVAQNLDTALIAAGLFGSYLGVKYVAQMILATGATVSFEGATYALGVAVGRVSLLLKRFLPIAIFAGIAKVIELFLRLKKNVGGIGEAFGVLKDVIVAFFKALPDLAKAGFMKMSAGFFEQIGDMITGFNKFGQGVADVFNKLFNSNIEFTFGAGAAEDMYALSNSALATANSITESSDAVSTLKTKLAQLAGLMVEDKVVVFGGKIKEETDKAKSAADELKKKMESLANAIQSSMENSFMSIVDGTKSVKDAFKAMASDIIKELYRVLVVQRIVGSAESGTGIVGSIFGALSGAKAMGGPVTGGKPYLVGERGPEIVVPQRNATVIPNSASAGGAVVVNQTINVSTGVQQTVRTEIKSLMPQIADGAKAAVLDAKRRGGSYGRGFA